MRFLPCFRSPACQSRRKVFGWQAWCHRFQSSLWWRCFHHLSHRAKWGRASENQLLQTCSLCSGFRIQRVGLAVALLYDPVGPMSRMVCVRVGSAVAPTLSVEMPSEPWDRSPGSSLLALHRSLLSSSEVETSSFTRMSSSRADISCHTNHWGWNVDAVTPPVNRRGAVGCVSRK